MNGVAVVACLDTGFSGLLATPRAEAQALGLRLEEAEANFLSQSGTVSTTHAARGVAVAAFGRQVRGDAILLDVPGAETLVGMAFLEGASIRFGEDSRWDVALPEEQGHGAAEATEREDTEKTEKKEQNETENKDRKQNKKRKLEVTDKQ